MSPFANELLYSIGELLFDHHHREYGMVDSGVNEVLLRAEDHHNCDYYDYHHHRNHREYGMVDSGVNEVLL